MTPYFFSIEVHQVPFSID